MSDPDLSPPFARIDAALVRIEAALAARTQAAEAMQRRHGALKARMADAVSALDEMLARGG